MTAETPAPREGQAVPSIPNVAGKFLLLRKVASGKAGDPALGTDLRCRVNILEAGSPILVFPEDNTIIRTSPVTDIRRMQDGSYHISTDSGSEYVLTMTDVDGVQVWRETDRQDIYDTLNPSTDT